MISFTWKCYRRCLWKVKWLKLTDSKSSKGMNARVADFLCPSLMIFMLRDQLCDVNVCPDYTSKSNPKWQELKVGHGLCDRHSCIHVWTLDFLLDRVTFIRLHNLGKYSLILYEAGRLLACKIHEEPTSNPFLVEIRILHQFVIVYLSLTGLQVPLPQWPEARHPQLSTGTQHAHQGVQAEGRPSILECSWCMVRMPTAQSPLIIHTLTKYIMLSRVK